MLHSSRVLPRHLSSPRPNLVARNGVLGNLYCGFRLLSFVPSSMISLGHSILVLRWSSSRYTSSCIVVSAMATPSRMSAPTYLNPQKTANIHHVGTCVEISAFHVATASAIKAIEHSGENADGQIEARSRTFWNPYS